MTVYADNAATTALSEAALEAMKPMLTSIYGNPSSFHTLGQKAKEKTELARQEVAQAIGASAKEIYFVSGGSEADNQAIRTAAYNGALKGKKKIISTPFEHHAVLNTLKALKKEGFEIEYLDVKGEGIVNVDELESKIDDNTCLVTIMAANNEIGTLQPIEQIGAICSKKGVVFHTDAVQAVGHIPIDVEKMNIDMLSLSAHKFHGPKGVGALYVRKGIRLRNLIEGGEQERGKRAGTENTAAIVGMAAAIKEAVNNLDKNAKKITALRNKLAEGLSKIECSYINGSMENRLPGNLNMCFDGVEGESILLLLDQKGICASSGSACTSGSLEASHVLLAIGVPVELAHGSLRLTLSEYNTEEEIDYIIKSVPEVVARLRDMSPVWEKMQNQKEEL